MRCCAQLGLAVVLTAFAVGLPSLTAKELQPIGNPVKVMPEKAMQVQFNADGTVTPLSDWYYFDDSSSSGGTGTAASSLNLFDSFENDGDDCITGAAPDGGTDCGLPGGGSRWFFGPSYCNMFTVGSFSATSTTPGDRLEFGWFWYCSGSGLEECFVAIFTGTPFDDTCNAAYTLGAGVVLDFGTLACNGGGYFYTDVCLCDFGLALDMFTNTYASIGGVLAQAFDGQNLTLATCGQFMLWGADGDGIGGGHDLAGTHDDISYDDDNPSDGQHTSSECYSYFFGICPDPLHFMVGLGTCGGAACDAVVRDVCVKDTNGDGVCEVVIVKGSDKTPGDTFEVSLSNGSSRTTVANYRGKWEAKFTGRNIPSGGSVGASACGSSRIGVCANCGGGGGGGEHGACCSRYGCDITPPDGCIGAYKGDDTTCDDSDGDGAANVCEGCPDDPDKQDPGVCGCGTPDTDNDRDGKADCIDNCPSVANPDQTDRDSDGVGDACETKPPSQDGDFAPGAPKECGPCSKRKYEVGDIDPVYLFSGEFYESVVDLQIPGRGMDFVWSRKYRSHSTQRSELGHGWEWSYGAQVELDINQRDLILHDGSGRRDTMPLQGDGTWSGDGMFQSAKLDGAGRVVLTFANTGTWTFHPFDGQGHQGKLACITDRNDNNMCFDYDSAGRLVTIHDTLDDSNTHNRDIRIAYNADGFIESVTDWTGREVRYEYYRDGDTGGSSGDLKSVRTPKVEPTGDYPFPSRHAYPQGKTTVYTYTTGFSDERLNHDLLTIQDGRGRVYLRNSYAHTVSGSDPRYTEDPQNLYYDRIVRQAWGDATDIIELTYAAVTPDEGQNNGATLRTVLNDRVGNVTTYFYDAANHGVMERRYTGRWMPGQRVDDPESGAPPIPPLRGDDRQYFETRYEYDPVTSLRSGVLYPNLNEEVLEYDVNNPNPRSRGNLLKRTYRAGPLGGDQAERFETFEYDDEGKFGGCCGTNFVIRHVDFRGNATSYQYDDLGNRTLLSDGQIPCVSESWEYNRFGQMTAHVFPDNGTGHRRRDEFTYYDRGAGHQYGYRKQHIMDAAVLRLKTSYEYDRAGNTIRVIDARSNDTLSVFNQLNQAVLERSAPVELPPGSGNFVRYERESFFDANDNVVRIDVQNIDDHGRVVADNPYLTTIYEYETLNRRTRTVEEFGRFDVPRDPPQLDGQGLPADQFVTTQTAYDANRNPVLVRFGEATRGAQPSNIVRTLFDERNLVYRVIRAEGDPDQATAQRDYDGNGNLKRLHEGLEDEPHMTEQSFDGYDRLVRSVDAMGNAITYHYDANGNRTSERVDGELLDVDGSAGNRRLAETTFVYDAVNRLIEEHRAFFDPRDGSPIGDGDVFTRTSYSCSSQVLTLTDDRGNVTRIGYDTANRRNLATDARGNSIHYGYDDNSNLVQTTETEKSDLGRPDEVFVTTRAYDALNRSIRTTDNVGNTLRIGYDSRGNRARTVDALGHEIRLTYDGLNRALATVRDLDGDGADGDGPDITTQQKWDASSRLIGQTDDNGNTTIYVHDPLDRVTAEVYADGTQQSFVLDVHDNRVRTLDANGTTVTSSYDRLDRLVRKDMDIPEGSSVSRDTTFETFAFDGLSRLGEAVDNDSTVRQAYDSLSNVIEETLNGRTTSCAYDGEGNLVRCAYPGGRVVSTRYDALNRKQRIADGPDGNTDPLIAQYAYLGPGRVERREYGNGTRTDFTYDGINNTVDDFGVKHIIGTRHARSSDGMIIDDRVFTWDRMANKTKREDTRADGPRFRHDYAYDPAYRLVRTLVTNPDGALMRDTKYRLDGVHNRTSLQSGPPDGPPQPPGEGSGRYSMSPFNGDRQMNQYTTTPFDVREYDDNGNLVLISRGKPTQRQLIYDYRNRLVEARNTESGERHTYAYDPLGRRIVRITDADGAARTSRYYYHGWQIVEQRDREDVPFMTFAYGPYIDEVLNLRREPQCAQPATGLIAWWPGEGNAQDIWGGHHGQPRGEVDFPQGRVGTAFGFDANQEGVTIPDDGAFQQQDALSVEYWIWVGAVQDGADQGGIFQVLDKGHYISGENTPGGWMSEGFLLGDGKAYLMFGIPGLSGAAETCDVTVETWHHVAGVYDGSTIQLYLDGRRADGRAVTGNMLPNQLPITIGYYYAEDSRFFRGRVDEVSVYGRALSADEIATIHSAGAHGKCRLGEQPTDYYYHTDDLYNVMAITDAAGNVVERYEYHDYGQPLDPTTLEPSTGNLSRVGNRNLFTGREYDRETQLYFYRSRLLDTLTGGFVSRDGIGTWTDRLGYGNARSYVAQQPWRRIDPSGMLTADFGVTLYPAGFGGGVELSVEKSEKDCCDHQNRLIRNGDRSISVAGKGEFGIGFGAELKIAGVSGSLLWRGPRAELQKILTLRTTECGGPINQAEVSSEYSIMEAPTVSASIGFAEAQLFGEAKGTLKLALIGSASKATISLSFCGIVQAGVSYRLFGVGDDFSKVFAEGCTQLASADISY